MLSLFARSSPVWFPFLRCFYYFTKTYLFRGCIFIRIHGQSSTTKLCTRIYSKHSEEESWCITLSRRGLENTTRYNGDSGQIRYKTLRIWGQYENKSMESARRLNAGSLICTRDTKHTDAASERFTDNIVDTLQIEYKQQCSHIFDPFLQ